MTAPDAAHSRHGEPAALSHLRVLDLTGPGAQYCGRLMADLGADVVKVEPPEGDSTRRLRPYVGHEPGPERGIRFLSLNANKRSVALDLREETGRRRFDRAGPGGGHPGGRRLGVRAGRPRPGIRRAQPRQSAPGVRDHYAFRPQRPVQQLPVRRADSPGRRRSDVRLRRPRRPAGDGAVFPRAPARGAARRLRGAGRRSPPRRHGTRPAHRGVRPGGARQHPRLLRALLLRRADQPPAGRQPHHRAHQHLPHQRRLHLHAAHLPPPPGRPVRVAGQPRAGGRPVEGRGVPAAERRRAERPDLRVQQGLHQDGLRRGGAAAAHPNRAPHDHPRPDAGRPPRAPQIPGGRGASRRGQVPDPERRLPHGRKPLAAVPSAAAAGTAHRRGPFRVGGVFSRAARRRRWRKRDAAPARAAPGCLRATASPILSF